MPLTSKQQSLLDKLKASSAKRKGLVQYAHTGEILEDNPLQQKFVALAALGKSCVLLGAAGTGKTTCQKMSTSTLAKSSLITPLKDASHKYLYPGTPGIVLVSFTNVAVDNIRRVVVSDLQGNCITIHKLLEFYPEFEEIWDEESMSYKKKVRYIPKRNFVIPLDSNIHTIIIEESSMVSVELFALLVAALVHKVQFIFIGDIQQLPPVGGSSILGYAMNKLPVVELTHVYRQALESPIIRLAHKILAGKGLAVADLEAIAPDSDELKFRFFPKRLHPEKTLIELKKLMCAAFDSGRYDPLKDMILIPFNKHCGTTELNKYLATHITRARKGVVHEVIAGFQKHYLAVGDKVLVEKRLGVITSIEVNKSYAGQLPQPPSEHLDYWGQIAEEHLTTNVDDILDGTIDTTVQDVDNRFFQCSHSIEVGIEEGSRFLSTSKEINSLLLAYAITVHKAQGSEWDSVFFFLHHSHNIMLQRELLYTAVTRARKNLIIVCEKDSFIKGVERQKIKGNTLKEKAAFFANKETMLRLPIDKLLSIAK